LTFLKRATLDVKQ